MRVLLINPSIRPNSPKTMLNVGLAYVASAIDRAGHTLEILDVDAHRYSEEEIARLIQTKDFDLVGIGDLVSHYKWVKWVSALLKAHHPEAPIIVGNTLGTSIPALLLKKTSVDIAVLSEGDTTSVDLLDALSTGRPWDDVPGIAFLRDGEVIKTASRPVIADVNSIPFPNYDLFEMDHYLEKSKWHVDAPETLDIPFEKLVAMPVVTARGCPYTCSFCYHAFQNKKYRYRSPENIVAEIEELKERYKATFITFWDELSFFHLDQVKRLTELFIERDLNMSWQGSCRSELISEADVEVARNLKKAGCVGLSFSLENGNPEILKAMNKKNTVEDFLVQAKILQDVGITTYTSVVFGYPQETPATIRETFDVLRRARIYPSVGYLQPMPGTPMYESALRDGHIPDEEAYLIAMGDRQDLRINLTSMSQEEMEGVIEEELRALNLELEIGLADDQLIKTGVGRRAKSEAFQRSFGVAGKIYRESLESRSSPRTLPVADPAS